MRIPHRPAATALLVLASTIAVSSRGDSLLVGNLADAAYGSDVIDATTSRAQGFLTGGRDWNLTAIRAVLGGLPAGGTFAASAMLVAATRNAQGEDVPDLSTPVATFLLPPVAEGFAALSFTPTTSVLLKANTEYWFVIQATSPGADPSAWRYTYDTTLDSASEGFLTSAAATLPPGSGEWRSQPNAPYLIQINGSPVVPEPSGWVLGALGLAPAWTCVRRRSAPITS